MVAITSTLIVFSKKLLENILVFLIAAKRQLGLLLTFSWFLQLKEFELFWGAVCLRSLQTFS